MRDKLIPLMNINVGIPKIYWYEYLDEVKPLNDEQKTYIDKLKEVENGKWWSLVVLGTVGNGKTRLASDLCSLNEYYHPWTTKYTTQERLVDECKRTFSDNYSKSEADVVQDYERASLLVIDEITTRNWTDYSKNLIQKIISYRHENRKKTVLIGNINSETLKQMFDPHIISRLREGETHVMVAPDMRVHGDF